MRTPLALLLAALPAAARADDALDAAAALHRAGRHAEALAALDAAPPPATRLTRWSVSAEGRTVHVALVGRKHVVITTHSSRREDPAPPAGPAAGPWLDDFTSKYDFNTLVTGFDAVTGKRLWTRRAPGHNDVAIDDRTDAVYVWRERLFKLNPATGATDADVPLPSRPERVEALLIDGRVYRPRPGTEPRRTPPRVRAYDVDGGKVGEFDPALSRLSPDERRVVALATGGGIGSVVSATRLRADAPDWKYEHPAYSENDPVWLGGDVLALLGSATGKADVVRLNGRDGTVKWRFALPRGAYAPGRDQLPGNSYPDRTWTAVGPCGEYILAVGGEGALYFLEPDTGRLAAKATPATKYLAFPRLIDGALVVCAFDGVRAIPWDVIRRRGPDEGDRVVLRARCLHALGRTEAAREALDDMLKIVPDRAEAWAVKADVSRAAERPFDEIAARCRHLELSGRDSSPELRERWGLVKRISTGQNAYSDLRAVGDAVYASTASGSVLVIDPRTLHVDRTDLPVPPLELAVTETVKAKLSAEHAHDVTAPAEHTPPKAPAAFLSGTGYDGWPVRWQGKWYRPMEAGAVRVLDGDAVRDFPPRVKGLKAWRLYVSPWGPPLGVGAGGVYDLDENLVPVRVLIPLPGESSGRRITGDARTLAVLTHRGPTSYLQVWARDGSRMLREQPVLPPGPVSSGYEYLTPLAGGYLYSGFEVAWLPAGPGPAWRFGFGATPGPALPKLYYDHTSLFGRPVVRDGLLFAGCRDGAVYGFDLAAVTGR